LGASWARLKRKALAAIIKTMKTFREHGLELIGQESGFSFSVSLNGQYAYSSASWDGLRILDISDPTKPTNVGSIKFNTHTSRTFVNNNIAYIAEGSDDFDPQPAGIRLIDVSNKTKPVEIGHILFNDFTEDVVEKDNLIYALVSYGAEPFRSTLQIIEYIPPSKFSIVASYDFEHRVQRIVIAKNYAFLAVRYAGVQVIDISTPNAPKHICSYTDPLEVTDIAVAEAGDFVFAATTFSGWSGLRVLRFSPDKGLVDIAGFEIGGPYGKIAVQDSDVYLTQDWYGIWAVDIRDKIKPIEKGFYNIRYANDIAVNGEHIFVSANSNGLLILRPIA
jgi:hypothetical protein